MEMLQEGWEQALLRVAVRDDVTAVLFLILPVKNLHKCSTLMLVLLSLLLAVINSWRSEQNCD